MGEMMVRKQIYLPRKQNLLLKQLAKQRGVSEAEVIRRALEREVQVESVPAPRESKAALDEILKFVETLRERSEFMEGEPYKFNREEIYAERENRWVKPRGEE